MGKKEISKIFKLPIGWWKRVPSFQSSQALRPRNRRSGPRRRGNTWVGSIASSNSHTQVHASRTNSWIGDHVMQYFLFTTLSNHLLLHLSQMKLNEINCWRVWIWRAHTSCASGKLPYYWFELWRMLVLWHHKTVLPAGGGVWNSPAPSYVNVTVQRSWTWSKTWWKHFVHVLL